jgi:hypothetical protein
VCIVNESGKGRAVLLNFSVFDAPADKLIPDMLAASGVTPAIQVAKTAAQGQKGIEVTRWADGNMELLALLGDYAGEAKVTLPETRTVYDLRKGARLENTAEFTTVLRPNRASFIALSRRAIAAPQLSLKNAIARQGGTVTAMVGIPQAEGQHAVIIRATTPTGKVADWLDTTVIAGPRPVSLTLPFALNDPAGDWHICATELFSGEKTVATLILR